MNLHWRSTATCASRFYSAYHHYGGVFKLAEHQHWRLSLYSVIFYFLSPPACIFAPARHKWIFSRSLASSFKTGSGNLSGIGVTRPRQAGAFPRHQAILPYHQHLDLIKSHELNTSFFVVQWYSFSSIASTSPCLLSSNSTEGLSRGAFPWLLMGSNK